MAFSARVNERQWLTWKAQAVADAAACLQGRIKALPTVIEGWWCVPSEWIAGDKIRDKLAPAAATLGERAPLALALWEAEAALGNAGLFVWRASFGHGAVLVRAEADALHVMAMHGRRCIDPAEAFFDAIGRRLGLSRVIFETGRPGLRRIALNRGWREDGDGRLCRGLR